MNSNKNAFAHTYLPITSLTSGIGQEVVSDIFYLPIQIVNICFIGRPQHPKDWVLIDAGMPHSAEEIINVAKERFGKEAKPKAIVLTHGHFDHVGSLSQLLEQWDIPVYAHKNEIPYLTENKSYPKGDPTVDGGLVSEMSPMFPNHGINLGDRVEQLPPDGSVPGLSGWRWIHTPGHTPGHISLFRDIDRSLIVGDAFVTVKQESLFKVMVQKQEISGPPKYFTTDWKAAWESVRKLEALKPSRAITGHGLPMTGSTLNEKLETLAKNFDRMAIPKEGRYVDQ